MEKGMRDGNYKQGAIAHGSTTSGLFSSLMFYMICGDVWCRHMV